MYCIVNSVKRGFGFQWPRSNLKGPTAKDFGPAFPQKDPNLGLRPMIGLTLNRIYGRDGRSHR